MSHVWTGSIHIMLQSPGVAGRGTTVRRDGGWEGARLDATVECSRDGDTAKLKGGWGLRCPLARRLRSEACCLLSRCTGIAVVYSLPLHHCRLGVEHYCWADWDWSRAGCILVGRPGATPPSGSIVQFRTPLSLLMLHIQFDLSQCNFCVRCRPTPAEVCCNSHLKWYSSMVQHLSSCGTDFQDVQLRSWWLPPVSPALIFSFPLLHLPPQHAVAQNSLRVIGVYPRTT